MLDYMPIFRITFQWLRLLRLYMQWRQGRRHFRRWWVKPHIRNQMRDQLGAFQTLFMYYAQCDHEEFYNMTRMTPDQFEALHCILRRRLQKTSLRRSLPTRLRLALCLNYLAHGDSNRTTANLFRVGRSTVYSIIGEVCPVIWELLSPQYLRMNDPIDWRITAEGFRMRWDFPNCIGAVDGKEIRIKMPPGSGSLFYNYKKFFSLKLLAACDAYYRFTWIDVGDFGSVSDISAFNHTEFYRALENNEAGLPLDARLPRSNIVLPYCFVGDEIFTLKRYMMRPFARNRGLTRRQINFNYRLSRARNCIEDAFGILTARWKILHRRLDFKLETSIAVVQALVCLHNFILSDELIRDEDNRLNCRPNQFVQNVNDDPHENEQVEVEIHEDPPHAVRQREILADYFESDAGALR